MSARNVRRMLLLLVTMLLWFQCMTVRVEAAGLDLDGVRRAFASAIADGSTQVSFETDQVYTTTQITDQLDAAAISKKRVRTGTIQIQWQVLGNRARYVISLPKGIFQKVTILKSEGAARRAALRELKKGKYTKTFYSEVSYRDEFLKMLEQHPEYNYDTSVWHSSNGTYGFQISGELTASELSKLCKTADKKAAAIASRIIKKGMSDKQKVKAIHDYLIRHCEYDHSASAGGFDLSFTAYGALQKKEAVCQGYAGAFNLIAQKAGILSFAACGRAGGESHAWNFVKIGKKYRFVDCTWDDAGESSSNQVRYTYFCLTTEQMARDHTWTHRNFSKGYFKYCKVLVA